MTSRLNPASAAPTPLSTGICGVLAMKEDAAVRKKSGRSSGSDDAQVDEAPGRIDDAVLDRTRYPAEHRASVARVHVPYRPQFADHGLGQWIEQGGDAHEQIGQ